MAVPATVDRQHRRTGLLDILPGTFDKIPKTLDTASKKDIVSRIGRVLTVRGWVERMAAPQI